MALTIKLLSHCQTFRILFSSSYLVYVNLNRYFQVTLASYRWSVTLLNHWQKLFIIQLSRNHRVQHGPRSFTIFKSFQGGWTTNCYHYIWFRSLYEGLSTHTEQSRKIQTPHYYDRYLPSHYGLLQDDWNKMSGSGFSDVLLEAGMITTGSMTGVMNGKKYSRAINCHKTLTEAIFRLLFNKFIEQWTTWIVKQFKGTSRGLFA